MRDEVLGQVDAVMFSQPARCCNLALRRDMIGGSHDETDAGVTKRDEMADGLFRCQRIVTRHSRESERCHCGIDQDDGDASFDQTGVVLVRCLRLGVQAACEHHPGHLLLEK